MSTVRIAPIDNPTAVREVAQTSWKHWPVSKDVPGGKMQGKDVVVIVNDEDIAKAKAPKTPTVPPEVQAMKNNGAQVQDAPKSVPVEGKSAKK